jgi:hypothetical protein
MNKIIFVREVIPKILGRSLPSGVFEYVSTHYLGENILVDGKLVFVKECMYSYRIKNESYLNMFILQYSDKICIISGEIS